MFVRDQTLMVQRFDERTLALAGDAVPIDHVATVNQYPVFSASANGRLAYRTASRATAQQLTWFTREGKAVSSPGERGAHEQLALSPDGSRAAYRDVAGTIAGDLWLADLSRGTSERFTFDRKLGGFPVWSPDGTRIAFRSALSILQKPSRGGGEAELLLKSDIQATPTSWSRDDKFLLTTIIGSNNTLLDIAVLATDGDRRVSSFLKTQYNESQGAFSPDGRWVAYTSDESGRNEVYVRPFTPPGATPRVDGKVRVSNEGGSAPVWPADGRELIFRAASSGAPMAVDVVLTATTFHAGIPKQLFATPPVPWSVSADGKRFLVSMPPPEDVQVPITIDLNWEAALKR
jgi:Tol biopolymer transport system component